MTCLVLELTVVPSSGKLSIILDKRGLIKCYLKSPPEEGKANRELVSFLASLLKLPKNGITIVSGLTHRKKRLKIETLLTLEQIKQALGLENQQVIS